MGKIHPVQGNWAIDGVRELQFETGTWTIAVRASSVVVVIEAPEPADLATFINEVRSIVGAVVDALGFGLAVPLRFEPTHAFKDDATVLWIHAGWPELREVELTDSSLESWVSEEQLAPLIEAAMASPLIRYALADVQRAVELPDDTAFYCYRAIESLRLLFLEGDRDDGKARTASWAALRTQLALSRSELDVVRLLANTRRHGGHRVLAEADRRNCLLMTRRAIRAAVNLPIPTQA